MAPRRRLLLWGALAMTLAAVAWVDRGDDPGPAKKTPRQAARGTPVAESAPVVRAVPDPEELTRADLARHKYAAGGADLFSGRSWLPPPPVVMPAGPAGAPALPFVYIGKMLEKEGTVVFLLHQERTLAVRQGDIIDETYRVEKIAPESMLVVYLPLKQQQSLNLGSAN